MKKIKVLLVVSFLFNWHTATTQTPIPTQEVFRLFDGYYPTRLVAEGNYIYTSAQANNQVGKLIRSKIVSPGDLEEVRNMPLNPFTTVFNGNDVYYTNIAGLFTSYTLSKVDITNPSSPEEVIYQDDSSFSTLFKFNNELYYGDYDNWKILKADLNATTLQFSDYISTGFRLYSAKVKNNYLYALSNDYEVDKQVLYKLDLTSSNPEFEIVHEFTNVSSETSKAAMTFGDNKVYMVAFEGKLLYVYDELNATVQEFRIDIENYISDILIVDETLYLVDATFDRVVKLELDDLVLSTGNIKNAPKIVLYPNPSSTFISISGLDLSQSKDYTIFNIIGSKLMSGSISSNEKINIQNLASGTYIIKFDNGSFSKFLKI